MVETGEVKNEKVSQNPLVTVGIPTYNRPGGLRRTLECITGQTYKNLEIIISDNCSPGLEIDTVIRKFMEDDRRIRYYRQTENKGISFNFQFVLEKATGEYFMWAADDDEWESVFISTMIKKFQENPGTSVAFCVFNTMDTHKSEIKPFVKIRELDCKTTHERILNFFLIGRGTGRDHLMYGLFPLDTIKKVFHELNPYLNTRGADHLIILKLLIGGRCIIEPKILFHKGIDSKNYSDDPCSNIGRAMLKRGWIRLAYFPGIFEYHHATRKILLNSKLPVKHKIYFTLIDFLQEFRWFLSETLGILINPFKKMIRSFHRTM